MTVTELRQIEIPNTVPSVTWLLKGELPETEVSP